MQALLEKFNGEKEKEYKLKGEERRDPLIKRFRISKLPEVLIFQISRFAKNNFFVEKNPTIVQYPVKHLDMGIYCIGSVCSKIVRSENDMSKQVLIVCIYNNCKKLEYYNKIFNGFHKIRFIF